jgi:hypothetical protein
MSTVPWKCAIAKLVKHLGSCNVAIGEKAVGDTFEKNERLAAHERRARIIDRLHKEAIKTAEYRSTQRKEATAKIVKSPRWRRAKVWFYVAIMFAFGLACVCALVGMVAMAI